MVKNNLICQECGGQGKYINDSIDMGGDDVGPIVFHIYEPCGWCDGTGLLNPQRRGEWLRYKKENKNVDKIPR